MPPGPPLPRLVQTALLTLLGLPFLEWLHRRYGDAATLRTLYQPNPTVAVFDPGLTRQIFQGRHDQLHAGEANSLLGPLLGQRSVLVLDGNEHLRHRRLMLPPFHGKVLALYEQAILDATDAEVDSWPVGVPFAVMPSMQSLTLRVIASVVFGFGPDESVELMTALRAYIDPIGQPRSLRALLDAGLQRAGISRGRRAQAFVARRRAVDDLVYAEIARRRALPEDELSRREDVFSTLLLARDEGGERLSDVEVRDELLTLLVAGHETTATGVSWALDLMLHTPAVHARARQGDDAYLDALFKEALRMRPVIGLVGRVVRGAPVHARKLGDSRGHRDQSLDPRDPPSRGSLPRARGVPPGALPDRGRARHLHVDPVRRRHQALHRRGLRSDRGTADHAPDSRAHRASRRLAGARGGPDPDHHPHAAQRHAGGRRAQDVKWVHSLRETGCGS